MPSQQTTQAHERCQRLADRVRRISADHTTTLNEEDRRSLEVAALLLEQTSVARYNKAVRSFNQANDRFIRRQKVGA